MGRRHLRAARCERCHLHHGLCLCDRIPTLVLATRVVLVMHRRERHRPTATGPLALRALPNHAWVLHGDRESPVDLAAHLDEGRRGLLLSPSPDARVLSAELLAADPRPVTLVVPDGSWRQAHRAARRLPGVERFEPVTLPPGPPSRYLLRRETKEEGLATMEAIARALGVLEGPRVQSLLEGLFDELVTRTLAMRQQPAQCADGAASAGG